MRRHIAHKGVKGGWMKTIGKVLMAAAILSVLAMASNAQAQCKQPEKGKVSNGMKVVAQWQGDNWWVGTVKSIKKNGNIDVLYSDNTWGKDKRPYDVIPNPDELYTRDSRPCFKKGDGVVAKWRNDSWWRATVTSVEGNQANITYSDNEKGNVKLTEMVPDYR